MADQNAQQGGQQDGTQGAGGEGTKGGGGEFRPITSQADLDRIIGERIARERGKYADYDDLKAKAQKWEQAEQESLTELERERKAREQLEAELAKYKTKEQVQAWAAEITKGSEVPPTALRGQTREELEEHFKELSSLLAKAAPKRTAIPPGRGDKGAGTEKGRAAAALRQLRHGDG